MEVITKRELNQHTAAALDRVTDSHDVIVTEHGRPRWRVAAVGEPGTVLDRLERAGRYVPSAAEPARWPDNPGGPAYTAAEAGALLDDMRGDH